jgi:hypothetical protein
VFRESKDRAVGPLGLAGACRPAETGQMANLSGRSAPRPRDLSPGAPCSRSANGADGRSRRPLRASPQREASANEGSNRDRLPQPNVWEFLAARSRLFQDGMGPGPAKASGARHRPTSRRREHVRARV